MAGTKVGITICEDMWVPGPPTTELVAAGAELVVNLSASPFHLGRAQEREAIFSARARESGVRVALCNTVGGQDELIFDGHSLVLESDGSVLARAPGFAETLLVVDLEQPEAAPIAALADDLEQMRCALVLGLRDYVGKNGFAEIVVGVSGGIDSGLTAALAVEALGPERVHCVSMPSRYSSGGTRSDARRLTENLGCDFRELPIEPVVEAFGTVLAEPFAGREPDLAEENLQARIRGTLLMALSNKFGWLLVATGNKSELSVGYATLYGDMAGGFALQRPPAGEREPAGWPHRAGGPGARPSVDDRPGAERRAAGQPARRGLAAAVSRARPGARGVRRGGQVARRAERRRVRSGRGRASRRVRRPGGIQAAAGTSRGTAPPEGLRTRPANADHEPLAGLIRSARSGGRVATSDSSAIANQRSSSASVRCGGSKPSTRTR